MKQKLSMSINKLAKLIDYNRPCISCGSYEPLEAGHYYSVGAFANMQWYIHNIHGQCHYCNQHLTGNREAYRQGLLQRYGTGYVDMLESFNAKNKLLKLNRYDIAELIKTINLFIKVLEQDQTIPNFRNIIDNHFKNNGYYL
jgi:hypothetical protein